MEQTDMATGLSSAEAEARAAAGESNGSFDIKTKSVGRIFRDNIFTLFNMINIIIAVFVALVGSWRNMLFMGVIICNIAIGIFQEIRSKRVIDRLSLISAPRARLLRDGRARDLPVADIVRGDVMLLSSGQQVCADGIILEGECEADESLITGECEPVMKQKGGELLSGSFITAGEVKALAVRVGAQSRSGRITSGSKYIKKRSSEMMKAINRIISVISVCIVPFGTVLFLKALYVARQSIDLAVVSTAAALIGMIPEGLVLLTSIALAVSSIRLARRQTLCQDLFCVESLARVDVLCLDKTGTITEGSMEVSELVSIDADFDSERALRAFSAAFGSKNPTLRAIEKKFGAEKDAEVIGTVPFSSSRKWSAAAFRGYGTVILGAPDFVLSPQGFGEIRSLTESYSSRGMRVLLAAFTPDTPENGRLPENVSPKALVILSDKIRSTAPETLEYFKEQGVALKVISGDDPLTVSRTAEKAGLPFADKFVDAALLKDDELSEAAEKYTVFGRVTPERKLALVKALKAAGHKVAMTGDGVNDVLALKEADCSIAMQSGSDAARCVSQLVLMNSDFASMPLVLAEGRRAINNIERSGSLFLVKTIFSFLLAVMFLILPYSYPFKPIQMTLISAITIGIPSFFLALEPNKSLVRGSFLKNVLRKAAPGGITVAAAIGLLMAAGNVFGIEAEHISTMAVFLTASVSFAVLFTVCRPFNAARGGMFAALAAMFVCASLFFGELFYIVSLSKTEILVLAALTGIAWLVFAVLCALFSRLFDKRNK